MPKVVHFGEFLKTWSLRSLLKGQKLVENPTIEKFKGDILGHFQTIWISWGEFSTRFARWQKTNISVRVKEMSHYLVFPLYLLRRLQSSNNSSEPKKSFQTCDCYLVFHTIYLSWFFDKFTTITFWLFPIPGQD